MIERATQAPLTFVFLTWEGRPPYFLRAENLTKVLIFIHRSVAIKKSGSAVRERS